jgi:hypothetical protein
MSDTIILRKVFAVDSNTGLFIPPGKALMTNGTGGTDWLDVLSTIIIVGGPVMNNVPSTISSFSTLTYTTNSVLSTLSSVFLQAICSLGGITNATTANVVTANLGTAGYVSTSALSTYVGQAVSTVTQSPCTISSLIPSLSTAQYANSSTISSVLASVTASTLSTLNGIGTLGFVSSLSLQSTVTGLGSLGYISSINTPVSFQSTVTGLGSAGYISAATLQKTVDTFGNVYVSSLSLRSTVSGLSTFGYPTNIDLSTAVLGVSAMKNSIRFDSVGNVILSGSSNVINFTNTGNVIYVSTFYQSSMYYSGQPIGSTIIGKLVNNNAMEFSTAILNINGFSNFINANSRMTIDVYPTYVFTKLGTGATAPAIVYISSLLMAGGVPILNTAVTNALYLGTTQVVLENGLKIDGSNIFNQPIKISVPQRDWTFPTQFSLYHYMPSSIQYGILQNALHSTIITPYFGSTGSIFVSVQNSV